MQPMAVFKGPNIQVLHTSYHDKLGNGQNAETGIVGMYEYVDVCPTLVKL